MKAAPRLLLLVALITGSCKDDVAPTTGTITVFVRYETILDLPRTLFSVGLFDIASYNLSAQEALYVKPLDDNTCTFEDVLPGNYRVVILESGGYSKAVQVKAGETANITFGP